MTFGGEAPQAVRLSVLDVAGRHVRTLEAGTVAPGRHRASWDGADGSGRQVPAGIYFARLEAGGTVRLQKLLRIR
jgi:flagellar hook assembly protein FlgD